MLMPWSDYIHDESISSSGALLITYFLFGGHFLLYISFSGALFITYFLFGAFLITCFVFGGTLDYIFALQGHFLLHIVSSGALLITYFLFEALLITCFLFGGTAVIFSAPTRLPRAQEQSFFEWQYWKNRKILNKCR